MSSHANISATRVASRSENRSSGTVQPKKPPSSTSAKPPQDQQTLKCPRCNSPNTKFCYYNNYSLSQPRHFCKTCRRYWTRGGALRNVPIGGGCRKTRKAAVKPSNSSSSCSATSSSSSSMLFSAVMEDSKFFQGFVPPATDFQLAGLSLNKIVNLNPTLSGESLYNENNNNNNNNNLQLCSSSSSFGDQHTAVDGGSGLSLMGFGGYPLTNPGFSSTGTGSVGVDGNLASSIETLSSLNQDLHWKLQQQRMAMIFGSKEATNVSETVSSSPMERPQPILFRNLEINSSGKEDSGETPTEWYIGNPAYAPNPVSTSTTTNDWHGVQAWADLNRFNALP